MRLPIRYTPRLRAELPALTADLRRLGVLVAAEQATANRVYVPYDTGSRGAGAVVHGPSGSTYVSTQPLEGRGHTDGSLLAPDGVGPLGQVVLASGVSRRESALPVGTAAWLLAVDNRHQDLLHAALTADGLLVRRHQHPQGWRPTHFDGTSLVVGSHWVGVTPRALIPDLALLTAEEAVQRRQWQAAQSQEEALRALAAAASDAEAAELAALVARRYRLTDDALRQLLASGGRETRLRALAALPRLRAAARSEGERPWRQVLAEAPRDPSEHVRPALGPGPGTTTRSVLWRAPGSGALPDVMAARPDPVRLARQYYDTARAALTATTAPELPDALAEALRALEARPRPPQLTPEGLAERVAQRTGVAVPGAGPDQQSARVLCWLLTLPEGFALMCELQTRLAAPGAMRAPEGEAPTAPRAGTPDASTVLLSPVLDVLAEAHAAALGRALVLVAASTLGWTPVEATTGQPVRPPGDVSQDLTTRLGAWDHLTTAGLQHLNRLASQSLAAAAPPSRASVPARGAQVAPVP